MQPNVASQVNGQDHSGEPENAPPRKTTLVFIYFKRGVSVLLQLQQGGLFKQEIKEIKMCCIRLVFKLIYSVLSAVFLL